MDLMKKIAISIMGFIVAFAAAWLAIWIANIFKYMMSLPVSVLGIMLENGSLFWQIVMTIISTGLAYLVVFYIFFKKYIRCLSNLDYDYPWFENISIVLLAICIVLVIDPRLGLYDIDAIGNAMSFLSNNCYYHIIAPVDWFNFDFSGDNISDIQYTVFDSFVIIAAIAACICYRFDIDL